LTRKELIFLTILYQIDFNLSTRYYKKGKEDFVLFFTFAPLRGTRWAMKFTPSGFAFIFPLTLLRQGSVGKEINFFLTFTLLRQGSVGKEINFFLTFTLLRQGSVYD
jgi:hypothetical protein